MRSNTWVERNPEKSVAANTAVKPDSSPKTKILFKNRENHLITCSSFIFHHKKVSFCVDVGVNAPNIFGVMGKGTAKLLKEKYPTFEKDT